MMTMDFQHSTSIMINSTRKRRIDCEGIIEDKRIVVVEDTPRGREEGGWDALQTLLVDNDLLPRQRILSPADACPLLLCWFRAIVNDREKLHVFRQWIQSSSSHVVKQELDSVECSTSTTSVSSSSPSSSSSSSSASSSASLAHLLLSEPSTMEEEEGDGSSPRARSNTGTCSTGRFVPDSNLLHTFYKSSPSPSPPPPSFLALSPSPLYEKSRDTTSSKAAMMGFTPKTGSAGTVMTVTLKQGGLWHTRSSQCTCSLGFTSTSGKTMTAQRIPGGAHGECLFIVPQLNTSSPHSPLVVHLSVCTSPHSPIVCLDSFYWYPRERTLKTSFTSDEDSEEVFSEGTGSTGEDEVGSPPPQALPPMDISTSLSSPTPKQMMSIRERMLEHVQRGGRSAAHLTLLQQPSVRVVWKNRRLDVPFKLRVECSEDPSSSNNMFNNPLTASKLIVLAVVADHKGRLQIDAVENYAEDPSSQGLINFSNLRMTKGTWGKEWSITFAAVIKASLNNPVVVGVSSPCPIVVKTRKNPQVRHGNRGNEASPPKSPPHFTAPDRKGSESPVPLKRHRVEDILNCPATLPPLHPPPPPRSSHSEDMASLLAAAEMKQQEVMHEGVGEGSLCPPGTKHMEGEQTFANFQNLLAYLEDVRQKRQVSLAVLEQPQPKRDSKILIVKKGKPFRTPFQVQLHSTALHHNPQNYVCAAVVRNDKGEEVAVRNSEIPFDWRGIACFAGLMVMKGTWGKTVHLTFEAKWATNKRGGGGGGVDRNTPPSWSAHTRMLVVAETSPTQLMCYTKDKKSPNGAA